MHIFTPFEEFFKRWQTLGFKDSYREFEGVDFEYCVFEYSVTSLTGASITGDRGISFLVSSFSIQMTLANRGIGLSGEWGM